MPRKSLTTKERLRLFTLHKGICHICKGKIHTGELWQVEHIIPWAMTRDDSDENRQPAHDACHKPKTKADVANIAKAKRRQAKHLGIKKTPSRPMAGTKASGMKKRMDGTVEWRT